MRKHQRAKMLQAMRENSLVQPSMLDKIISYIDPEAGYKRLKYKAITAMATGYLGASHERRSMSSYDVSTGDADADMLANIERHRQVSRHLVRNNPLAAGAINTNVTSVVGTGLRLQSHIDFEFLGMTREEAEAWEKNTEREFRLWAESPECDIERTLNFYDNQRVVLRAELESGDVFTLLPMVERVGSPYQTRTQIIEADRICNPDRQLEIPTFTQGVEKDEFGAPLRYHILTMHPGEQKSRWKREWVGVDAFGENGRRNIIHTYDKNRPGLSRGVPYLAPVVNTIKQLGDYTEAEITAAVVSGCFSVFIRTPTGEGLAPMQPTGEIGGSSTDDDYKIGPGAMLEGMPGEEIDIINPNRPNVAFDPFVLAILRQIGVGLEIPFEILIKHFTASYSASRAAMLDAWRYFLNRRERLASNWCQPVYEAWMFEAVAIGRINAPGFFEDPAIRKAYLGARWIGPARGQIDELKEVKAAETRIAIGLSTREEETAQMTGGDFEANHHQLVKEQKMRVEGGLHVDPTPDEEQRISSEKQNKDEDDAEAKD